MIAYTTIKLVTKDGRTVYPHDTHLQGPGGLNYRLDSLEVSGTVYVYEWPSEFTRRKRMHISDFGLTVVQR